MLKSAKTRSACAVQLNYLLGCWAATADYTSAESCAEAATALHECMRTTVRFLRPHLVNIRLI